MVFLHDLGSAASEALVPVLWRYEVSSVLARAQMKGTIPGQEVADFLEDLATLPIRLSGSSRCTRRPAPCVTGRA